MSLEALRSDNFGCCKLCDCMRERNRIPFLTDSPSVFPRHVVAYVCVVVRHRSCGRRSIFEVERRCEREASWQRKSSLSGRINLVFVPRYFFQSLLKYLSVSLDQAQIWLTACLSSPLQVNAWLTWLETADEEGTDSEAE